MSITINVQKINVRLAELGMSQGVLAEKLGIGRGTVSLMINTGVVKKDEVLVRLSNVLGLPPEELIAGSAGYIADITERLYKKRLLDEDSVNLYNLQARQTGDKENLNLWIVPVNAQGGFITGFVNRHFSHQIKRVHFPLIAGECFGFEVEGYSMFLPEDPEGTYPEGSWIICTLNEDFPTLRKGTIYVFQSVEGLCLKIFDRIENQKVYLRSLSPAFGPGPNIPLEEMQQVYNVEMRISKAKVNWSRSAPI